MRRSIRLDKKFKVGLVEFNTWFISVHGYFEDPVFAHLLSTGVVLTYKDRSASLALHGSTHKGE